MLMSKIKRRVLLMVEGEALQCVLFVDHLNVYDKCLRSRLGSGGSGGRPAGNQTLGIATKCPLLVQHRGKRKCCHVSGGRRSTKRPRPRTSSRPIAAVLVLGQAVCVAFPSKNGSQFSSIGSMFS